MSQTDEGDTIFDVDRVARTRVQRNDPSDLTIGILGAYGQFAINFPWIDITAGLRYDSSNAWGDRLSPRASAVARPLPELTTRVSYGASFLPPAPAQLAATPLAEQTQVGNADLESQNANTWEAAAGVSPYSWLRFDLVGFYTTINDRIEFARRGQFFTASNISESRTWGGEASGDLIWGNFLLKSDVSLQNTTVSDPKIPSFLFATIYGDDVAGGRQAPNAPQWMGHLHLSWKPQEAWGLLANLTLGYAGERKSSAANITELGESYLLDDYITLDAHVGLMKLPAIIDKLYPFIDLRATNLLDADYSHGGARGVDIPGLGRRLFLRAGLRY